MVFGLKDSINAPVKLNQIKIEVTTSGKKVSKPKTPAKVAPYEGY
jgi:hypothetical protein